MHVHLEQTGGVMIRPIAPHILAFTEDCDEAGLACARGLIPAAVCNELRVRQRIIRKLARMSRISQRLGLQPFEAFDLEEAVILMLALSAQVIE
ncbi:hypothetical protein D3C78_1843830 [compost metagenome]